MVRVMRSALGVMLAFLAGCGATRAPARADASPRVEARALREEPARLEVRRPSASPIVLVAWSPDSASLAVGREDWSIELWDVAARRRAVVVRAPGQLADLVWFERRLAATTHNGAVVWDGRTGETLARVDGNARTVEDARRSIVLARDLSCVARLEEDRRHVAVIDLATRRQVTTLADDAPIRLVRFLDAGALLWTREVEASLGLKPDAGLVAVDVATGRRSTGPVVADAWRFEVSESGRTIAVRTNLGFDVFDAKSFRRLQRIPGPTWLSLSPSGERALLHFDARLPATIEFATGHVGRGLALGPDAGEWSRDERAIELVVPGARLVRFDASTGAVRAIARVPVEVEHAVSPDGARVATWHKDGLAVFDLASELPVLEIDGASTLTDHVAFRADGGGLAWSPRQARRFASPLVASFGAAPARASWPTTERALFWFGDDREVARAYVDDRLLVTRFDGAPSRVLAERTFPAPTGGWELAIEGARLRLSNPRAGRAPLAWDAPVTDVAWTADASRAIAWSNDSGAAWSIATSGEPSIAPIDLGAAWNVALSPDGRRAIVMDKSASTATWDLERHAIVDRFRPPSSLFGFCADSETVWSFHFPPEPSVALLDLHGAVVGSIPLDYRVSMSLSRDFAPLVSARPIDADRLARVTWMPDAGQEVALAMTPDRRFLAIARRDVELVRLEDGARLRLVGFHAGAPIVLAFDDRGHVDGSDEALEHVGLEVGSGDSDEERAAVLCARRPGMIADFLRQKR